MDYIVGIPLGLLGKHECEAIVITCMDFRFRKATFDGLVETHLDIQTSDALIAPGGIKCLVKLAGRGPIKTAAQLIFRTYLLLGTALSLKLHAPKQLILVNHATCGAYGIADAKVELAKQKADMVAAREILAKKFPSLSIRLFFARSQGEREILYQEVK